MYIVHKGVITILSVDLQHLVQNPIMLLFNIQITVNLTFTYLTIDLIWGRPLEKTISCLKTINIMYTSTQTFSCILHSFARLINMYLSSLSCNMSNNKKTYGAK